MRSAKKGVTLPEYDTLDPTHRLAALGRVWTTPCRDDIPLCYPPYGGGDRADLRQQQYQSAYLIGFGCVSIGTVRGSHSHPPLPCDATPAAVISVSSSCSTEPASRTLPRSVRVSKAAVQIPTALILAGRSTSTRVATSSSKPVPTGLSPQPTAVAAAQSPRAPPMMIFTSTSRSIRKPPPVITPRDIVTAPLRSYVITSPSASIPAYQTQMETASCLDSQTAAPPASILLLTTTIPVMAPAAAQIPYLPVAAPPSIARTAPSASHPMPPLSAPSASS